MFVKENFMRCQLMWNTAQDELQDTAEDKVYVYAPFGGCER